MPNFAVILPAAGKSSRFKHHCKKTFATLSQRAVWRHSAERFLGRSDVKQVILVIAAEDRDEFKSRFGADVAFMQIQVINGGARRVDSVLAGLERLNDDIDYVCIHDAARPCLCSSWIDLVFAEAVRSGAALLATPVTGTLKRVGAERRVEQTVSRERLYEAQTPQVFRRDVLWDAYRRADPATTPTDDAQLVEQAGHPVTVVPGSPLNLKITEDSDLRLAELILGVLPKSGLRTGGVHPFHP